MSETGVVSLEFDPELNALGEDKSLRDGLSVAVQIGNTLWVANDETISLERLSLVADGKTSTTRYGRYTQFSLNNYLRLPVLPRAGAEVEEVDV